MSYVPAPLDTSDIELDPSLVPLLDRIGRNIHEVWSQGRLQEGWVLGPGRDDVKKTHPCLIPYEELADSEKAVDIRTVTETLKTILKLGYKILPPHAASALPTLGMPAAVADANANLAELVALETKILQMGLDILGLETIWRRRAKEEWCQHPSLHLTLGQAFLKAKAPLVAFDVFSEALGFVPEGALKEELVYRQAFALAEVGAGPEAIKLLEGQEFCYGQGLEHLELLARLHKDQAGKSTGAKRIQSLESSLRCYLQAYEGAQASGTPHCAYYSAINAATLLLLLGRVPESRELAEDVIALCRGIAGQDLANCRDHWLLASLGEASLLSGQSDEALGFYRQAVELARSGDARAIRSMRRQARLLASALTVPETLEAILSLPPDVLVVATDGVATDGAEGETLRSCDSVYAALGSEAELVALEGVLAVHPKDVSIVLPFPPELCKQTVFADSWHDRLDAAVAAAAEVHIVQRTRSGDVGCIVAFARVYAIGLSLFRSTLGGDRLVRVGWSRDGQGLLVPVKGPREAFAQAGGQELRASQVGAGQYCQFLAYLFADVKGFSKLANQELERFMGAYWSRVHVLCERYVHDTLLLQTAGDGLFVVFASVAVATRFARDLNECVLTTDWVGEGLPAGLSIRISLDAGPCMTYAHPVSRDLGFCGEYINRAARIEPITPPGKIYASESFVYVCKALGLEEVQFSYAGKVPLPKAFGTIPLFCLH